MIPKSLDQSPSLTLDPSSPPSFPHFLPFHSSIMVQPQPPSASWLRLSILHCCCSSLPRYMPSPSPWQLAPWGAAWYPAGHTHRKLPGVFSQRPRSHGGGTRWHSSTSAGTNRVAGAGADAPPPPLPQTAWRGWGGAPPGTAGAESSWGRGQAEAGARGGRGARSGSV